MALHLGDLPNILRPKNLNAILLSKLLHLLNIDIAYLSIGINSAVESILVSKLSSINFTCISCVFELSSAK